MKLGFMWNCPWRIEWRRRFEYWDRCQLGPFYALLHRRGEVATLVCYDYRPDHNGECLNCDEPIWAHVTSPPKGEDV